MAGSHRIRRRTSEGHDPLQPREGSDDAPRVMKHHDWLAQLNIDSQSLEGARVAVGVQVAHPRNAFHVELVDVVGLDDIVSRIRKEPWEERMRRKRGREEGCAGAFDGTKPRGDSSAPSM